MYRATCAHKEFPFGSILRITNRANGKSADCKVNDRGPFVSGRDIDLSYAVAKEIGLVGAGMGTVRIEYVGRDLSYVRQVRYVASGGPFTIQLGSFRERDNAIRLKTGLDLKYGGVYIIEAFVESTNYFRVRVGRFQRREEAAEVAKVMAEEGYSPLVTRYDERA